MLKGLATPVTFTVIPGVDNTDYRVDLRVPGIAPGAAPSLGNYASQNPVGSADLMAYLYGQTPDGASPLRVQGPAGVKAWQSINGDLTPAGRSEEHTSELQSLMRISYAVFCLKKKTKHKTTNTDDTQDTTQIHRNNIEQE